MFYSRFERSSRRIYNDTERQKKIITRFIYCMILVVLTITVTFWPGFHPETLIIPEYHWQLDMICHAGYYFIGSLILYTVAGKRKKFFAIFFPSLLILSWMLEIIQQFIPGRSFSILDLTSNTLGILLAVGKVQWDRKNRSIRTRKMIAGDPE